MAKKNKPDFEFSPYGLNTDIHKYSFTYVDVQDIPEFLIALGKFARKYDHNIEHILIGPEGVEVYWGG